MAKLPGIFNDVIGPVMRGPSSSHTAASWRIATVCLDILKEPLKKAIIDFDTDGAWASNYREQGTVMGISGGLLGLDISDPEMKETDRLAEQKGILITYKVASFSTFHANTVRLSLEGLSGHRIQVIAASLGGGAFEIQKINEYKVKIQGDYFELMILNPSKNFKIEHLNSHLPSTAFEFIFSDPEPNMVHIKSSTKFPENIISQLPEITEYEQVIITNPVLPVVSGNETELPFKSIPELLDYAKDHDLDLGSLGLMMEKYKSGLSEHELQSKMEEVILIIDGSIKNGLQGTIYENRILQTQSPFIQEAEKDQKIPFNTLINNTIAFVTSIMESKSAMEVIVANPTAGSCGTIGGLIKAVAEEIKASSNDVKKAYFAAGLVGVYFAEGPGFSAEEHGCQVECGAASGMAAAAVTQLYGGTAQQAINAASMAIQNMIGLVCDPVADRVEVPCLGKNISAAMNALSSATMACAGFEAVIPLDEVIETVSEVSKHMPVCIKCTGKGGLALTKTARNLKNGLKSF